jgi:hypothetical protein
MYEMNSQVLAAPLPSSSRKRTLVVALLAALAGAAITIGLLTASAGDSGADRPRATELRGSDFALAYPAGWAPTRADALAKMPGHPAAVVRRADGKGVVIVRRKGTPEDQSLKAMTRDLNAGLSKRFSDFRFVSAKVTPVRGGNAFLYTFVRTEQKTAQSIALVPVGKTTFTLDAMAASGDVRAAREVAAIVRSFGP